MASRRHRSRLSRQCLDTWHEQAGPFLTASPVLSRHGPRPIDFQIARTACVREHKREMEQVSSAVVVLGTAHLHSIIWKLREQFEVEAFASALEWF